MLGQLAPINLSGIEWVVMGPLTRNKAPDGVTSVRIHQWAKTMVKDCKALGIPVWQKAGMADHWDGPLIRQMPEALAQIRRLKAG